MSTMFRPYKIQEYDLEILQTEASTYDPALDLTQESHVHEFVIHRDRDVDQVKDRKKSQNQKHNYRRNKAKYKRGIRRFHRSAKGKRFHRALGNFVATRSQTDDRAPKTGRKKTVEESFGDILTDIYSLKSHLNICNRYVVPTVLEQAEWDILFEYANKRLTCVVQCLEEFRIIEEDDLYLIMSLLNPKTLEEVAKEKPKKDFPKFHEMFEDTGSLS